MRTRILSLGLAAVLGGVLAAPSADAAVVICQKKQKLKLRVDACKAKETQVDASELGVVGPAGPQGPEGPAGTPATALWAVVAGDGSLIRGSGVISSGTTGGEGFNEVIFDRDVTGCSYVATLGVADNFSTPPAGSIGVNGRFENVNGVFVITRDAADTAAGIGFHLAVFCP